MNTITKNPYSPSAWFTLIRWRNLLIILGTQGMIWTCVILPAAKTWEGLPPLLLRSFNFSLIAISTVLIAAAGYIINDYFDVRIDMINKPGKMVLEKKIPRRMAIIMHTLFNVLAILMAWYVARQRTAPEWLSVQIICTILLWFYSTKFKQRFMIGNVVVALLTSLTILTLVVYEPAMHTFLKKPVFEKTVTGFLHLNPLWLLGVYAYFAFVLTWMREIVKDMEDLKGDAEEGCETMPIRWGLRKATQFTRFLGVSAIVPLLISVYALIRTQNFILGSYAIVALILPLSLWIMQLNKKATTEHYARCSAQIKLIMVAGIGSLIINFIAEWLR
ncbi:MAG TPA: geranylgeranylglycerol-phosphate geranylgeranyltransferase [Flavipsychrobacter sp.]|nr:geranylgeranylglycerol-phosphate geranylgeranyltransferase [Flavipsychrobacter sp.]